ncbi:MAG: elongation factor G [Caldilineaceae bacterium]|nr:elongation factor G [Caldilineaceae bacterium]
MTTDNKLAQIRNIGMIAHIDAGKTTTTERILFYSGRTHQLGNVDEGTTVTDWWDQERERGITIKAAAITTSWRDTITGQEAQVNIIDTPGHIDFTAEVQRSLRVLDGGVVIFDAVNGVEPQSETVWRQANSYGVPRICFINKMDRWGADHNRTVEMIRERLQANPLLLQLPIGSETSFTGVIDLLTMQALLFTDELGAHPTVAPIPADLVDAARKARDRMVEQIAERDEALTLQYLAGEEIAEADLMRVLRRAVIANQLIPVLMGTALHNKGVQPLLDAIVRYLPSPLDVPAVRGIDPDTGDPVKRAARTEEPLCAFVFKVIMDPYAGRLAYVRVYSGLLRAGKAIYNANREKRERAQRLLQMQADKRTEIQECHAGDIVAIVGFKESTTGETLCDEQNKVILETIAFPTPVIKMAIEARSAAEQEKLTDALTRLDEEDPTFQCEVDSQTGQTVISGMGELHLEILIERLRREYGVDCRVGAPQVAYRETVTKAVEAEGEYVREISGHHHFAKLRLQLAPNDTNAGFSLTNRIADDVLSKAEIAAAERGVANALQSGYLMGFPVVDVKVTLLAGERHPVHTLADDFEVAATLAMREAMRRARPILLEPVMRVETYVPEEYLGSVVNDFGARHGVVQQMAVSGDGTRTITAMTPLTQMIGYATTLRSMTSGRGTFTMELDHYEEAGEEIHVRFLGEGWQGRFYADPG